MKKKSMMLLIVMLAIGFAAVSTTLIINGKVGIGTNENNYIDGVVFDEDSLSSSDGTTAEVSESGRTITFTTQEMKNVGEEAKVNFKIKNYSQYNATLGTPAISCYFVNDHIVDTKLDSTSTNHEYMQLIPGTELNGTTINAGGSLSDESSVTVKQIKSYVGDTPMTVKFQCEINASATDSETPSVEKPVKILELPEGVTLTNDVNSNGIADIGDEISVGTESFFVMSQTDTELNVLAKYNLKVGGIYWSGGSKERTIATSEEGYGKQDAGMIGFVSNAEKRYGTVKFSNQKGWDNTDNATIDIRNDSYADGSVKDALYGESGYEKYIQETIPTAQVRLITKGEIEALINDGNALSYNSDIKEIADAKKYSWIYSTSYWTQSASSAFDYRVWAVYSHGIFDHGHIEEENTCGVRPVITIPLV